MIAQMSVQIILALVDLLSPSAGIGRQDELKIIGYLIVEVQVLSRIYKNISFGH